MAGAPRENSPQRLGLGPGCERLLLHSPWPRASLYQARHLQALWTSAPREASPRVSEQRELHTVVPFFALSLHRMRHSCHQGRGCQPSCLFSSPPH